MFDYHAANDETIIARSHDGDDAATDFLLEKYKPLVKKKARTLFLIGGDNDDLIQEGMIALYKAIRAFRADRESSFVPPAGRICPPAAAPIPMPGPCDTTGNKLIEKHDEKGRYTVVIEKGAPACTSASNVSAARGRGKTLILFSDDLDKALATFVLANGAAATGQKVTIFFTFWGLNVLKKVQKPSVQKDFFGKMFGMMLPSSSLKLKLSQMNMFGMGSRMMRFLMKRKGVDSLESLRSQALAQGVEFIACQMSMDMMGIQHEELLDEVTIGGVATYMERADKANVNLFI